MTLYPLTCLCYSYTDQKTATQCNKNNESDTKVISFSCRSSWGLLKKVSCLSTTHLVGGLTCQIVWQKSKSKLMKQGQRAEGLWPVFWARLISSPLVTVAVNRWPLLKTLLDKKMLEPFMRRKSIIFEKKNNSAKLKFFCSLLFGDSFFLFVFCKEFLKIFS